MKTIKQIIIDDYQSSTLNPEAMASMQKKLFKTKAKRRFDWLFVLKYTLLFSALAMLPILLLNQNQDVQEVVKNSVNWVKQINKPIQEITAQELLSQLSSTYIDTDEDTIVCLYWDVTRKATVDFGYRDIDYPENSTWTECFTTKSAHRFIEAVDNTSNNQGKVIFQSVDTLTDSWEYWAKGYDHMPEGLYTHTKNVSQMEFRYGWDVYQEIYDQLIRNSTDVPYDMDVKTGVTTINSKEAYYISYSMDAHDGSDYGTHYYYFDIENKHLIGHGQTMETNESMYTLREYKQFDVTEENLVKYFSEIDANLVKDIPVKEFEW